MFVRSGFLNLLCMLRNILCIKTKSNSAFNTVYVAHSKRNKKSMK